MKTPSPDSDVDSRQLEALLKVSRTIAGHQEFGALLNAIAECLHEVVDYNNIDLLIYDATTKEAFLFYPGFLDEDFSEKGVDEFPCRRPLYSMPPNRFLS